MARSIGKSGETLGEYIEDVEIPFTFYTFSAKLREFVERSPGAPLLTDLQVKNLFEISLEYLKTDIALRQIKGDKVEMDWRYRRKIIEDAEKRLREWQASLKPSISASDRPSTSALATHLMEEVTELRNKLAPDFAKLKWEQRVNEAMLRELFLTKLRREYVMDLKHYIQTAFSPAIKKKDDRNLIIAATMVAARIITDTGIILVKGKEKDPLHRIPMAVSKASKLEKELRKQGIALSFKRSS